VSESHGGLVKSEILKIEAKGLLFDMDGVLVSSIGSVVRCWRKWCALYGVAGAETFEVPHGMRAIDIIRSLRPDLDDAGAIEGLRVIEDLEIEDTADLRVLPGVRVLLESIPPERWAIVTSATRRLLLGRLQVAGLPVPTRVVAADDVVKGKPDPEPYIKGAEMLGFRPIDCVVVEDAPAGAGAGAAAGSAVLGVLGTHNAADLTACTWIIPSLEGLVVTAKANSLELEFSPI
jgi:sugar-phosphatase